jgi:outer membrane protein assembly factor BamB
MALDVATGETVWETPRPVRASWATPAVISTDGGEQVVTAADQWVISYDVETGAELWRAGCLGGDIVTSPFLAGGFVFTAMELSRLSAIRPDGRGDVTATHVVWSVSGDLPSICTPLHDGLRLYCLASSGILTCWAPETGQLRWDRDTEVSFQASPVLAAGRIYMFGDDGVCLIIKAADEYEEVGRPELGEECAATPAFVGGRIYARGKSSLFCIAEE